jgi:hypothetical protein
VPESCLQLQQIRGGIVQHIRRRGVMLLLLACLLVALLFLLEWLGSEQPQHWVETPIAVPPQEGAAKGGNKESL